jgi:NAD-dependent SIR2 family protein deacetylase
MDELLASLQTRSKRPLVIFLGAGASKTFDYPLTRELMFRIFQGLHSGQVLAERTFAHGKPVTVGRELFNFLARLLPGERLTQDSLPLVTGVLSLLDFAIATGQVLLPGTTLVETRRMRRLLERAILEVIPDLDLWDVKAPAREDYFATTKKLLARIMQQRPAGKVAVVTTNYDMLSDWLALELAGVSGQPQKWDIHSVAQQIDFGFRWVHPTSPVERLFPRPPAPKFTLLKLHGSTNWLRCPLCENIYINPNGPIGQLVEDDHKLPDKYNSCHCSPTRLEPQIVSPSFVREMREPNLVATWKCALEILREADHWLMVGYSFPDEDVGIRALLTRAYGSRPNQASAPRVSVVQLDDKARVNYESFFPPGTVKYYTGGFNLLLDRVKEHKLKFA